MKRLSVRNNAFAAVPKREQMLQEKTQNPSLKAAVPCLPRSRQRHFFAFNLLVFIV